MKYNVAHGIACWAHVLITTGINLISVTSSQIKLLPIYNCFVQQ